MVPSVLLTRLGPVGRVFVGLLGVAVVGVSAAPAAVRAAPSSQTINYLGEQVTVPAAWHVQDLAAAPSACVRFDVHVVYEGRTGPQPDCPARVVGGTEALHLEPLAGRAVPPGLRQASIGGQPAQVNSAAAWRLGHRIVVAFPQGGVLATISFGSDESLAQQVLASFTLVAAAAPR